MLPGCGGAWPPEVTFMSPCTCSVAESVPSSPTRVFQRLEPSPTCIRHGLSLLNTSPASLFHVTDSCNMLRRRTTRQRSGTSPLASGLDMERQTRRCTSLVSRSSTLLPMIRYTVFLIQQFRIRRIASGPQRTWPRWACCHQVFPIYWS